LIRAVEVQNLQVVNAELFFCFKRAPSYPLKLDIDCDDADCFLRAGDGVGSGCGGEEMTEAAGWGADWLSGNCLSRCLSSYLNLVSASIFLSKKHTVPSASCYRGARNWTLQGLRMLFAGWNRNG
jgi:hypothetical protein